MSICDQLILTYNTNIIDKVSDKEKFIWNEVCKFLITKKCDKKIFDILKNMQIKKNYRDVLFTLIYTHFNLQKKYKNYKEVLSTLIYNHFNLQNNPKPNYRYISGPTNCSLWTSDKYKKNIYIFGEYHGIKENCSEYKETKGNFIEIQKYFKQLFKTTDVFIDFYLEIQSFKQQNRYKYFFDYIPDDAMFLNRLRKENYKCIDPKIRNKLSECKLIRSHYIDIRYYYIQNDFFDFYEYIYYNKDKYSDINNHKNIIDKISFSRDILEKNIIEIYKNIIKPKYEENIPDSLKGKINDFIINGIKNEIQKFHFFLLQQELKELQQKNQIDPKTLKHFLLVINVLIMDAYTLYRIFKNFKVQKTEKDQPISPHNIIIYTGDYHAHTYRTFLKSIGFINREQVGVFCTDYNHENQIIITKNLGERCLDMNGDGDKKITQPLFSFV